MPEAAITWPDADQMAHDSHLILQRHSLLDGAFGSCDGLRLPVQTSGNREIENATYNGWTHNHNVNSVFVFSPRGEHLLVSLIIYSQIMH